MYRTCSIQSNRNSVSPTAIRQYSSSLSCITLNQQISHFPFLKAPPYGTPPSVVGVYPIVPTDCVLPPYVGGLYINSIYVLAFRASRFPEEAYFNVTWYLVSSNIHLRIVGETNFALLNLLALALVFSNNYYCVHKDLFCARFL